MQTFAVIFEHTYNPLAENAKDRTLATFAATITKA